MEAPGLVETYHRFKDEGVTFISLNPQMDFELDAVLAYIEEFSIPWPVGYGSEETLRLFGVETLPAIVVVGRDGLIAWTSDLRSTLEEAIESALQAKRRGR